MGRSGEIAIGSGSIDIFAVVDELVRLPVKPVDGEIGFIGNRTDGPINEAILGLRVVEEPEETLVEPTDGNRIDGAINDPTPAPKVVVVVKLGEITPKFKVGSKIEGPTRDEMLDLVDVGVGVEGLIVDLTVEVVFNAIGICVTLLGEFEIKSNIISEGCIPKAAYAVLGALVVVFFILTHFSRNVLCITL